MSGAGAVFKGASVALRIAVAVVLAVAVLIVILSVRSCGNSGQEAAQATQDAKGADAYAGAAKEAVADVVAAGQREASVDAVVEQAVREIDDAKDPAAARAATLRAVCGLRTYRNRPECAMLGTDP